MSQNPLIKQLSRAAVHDSTGAVIGNVTEVFTDDNGEPSFVEVTHGLFGEKSSRVPLRGSRFTNRELRLPFTKGAIKKAPNPNPGRALTKEQEEELLRYYDVGSEAVPTASDEAASPGHGPDSGRGDRVGDDRADQLRDPHGLDQRADS